LNNLERIKNLPLRALASNLVTYLSDLGIWVASDGKSFSDLTSALNHEEIWLMSDTSDIKEGDRVLVDGTTLCSVIGIGFDDFNTKWYEVVPCEFNGISREFTEDRFIKV
jgi:hypothetical protein